MDDPHQPERRTYPESTPLALAELIDVAWSWLRWLRLPHVWRDNAATEFLNSELCAVCEARWRVGRGLRHGSCASGLDRAYHRIRQEAADLTTT